MKKFAKTFWLLLAVLMWSGTMQAQWPMQDGMAFATCFANNTGGFVCGVYDVRSYATQGTPGQHWAAPMYHDATWTNTNMGQVFGIAIDEDGNGDIFVTSTTCYSNAPTSANAFGPAGSGGIYRINGTTGAVSTFASLPNGLTGSGLGNIAYDVDNAQLFVTNHFDGLIYRFSMAGTQLSTFNFPGANNFPGQAYDPDFVPLGERLWGIGVNGGRVYFSVWNEDLGTGRSSATVANEIWSIGLDANGDFTGNAQLEITMPSYSASVDWSAPVSDIAFDCKGNILLAERGMRGDDQPQAHDSRVLEFAPNGMGGFNPAPTEYPIGALSNTNAAGGVDYGFAFDSLNNELYCDSMVWATGDALTFGSGNYTYGLAGLPDPNGLEYYVDIDNNIINQDKNDIGDVEVLGLCSCDPDTCDLDLDISYCCQSQGPGGDSTLCDLCDTLQNPNGLFWLWVQDENGLLLTSPPFIIEWTDPAGNVVSNAPAILAAVNVEYCVHVIDTSTPDSCEWKDCFIYTCDTCDLDLEISYCCQSQGIGGDPEKCDLCDSTENPSGNFWVWVEDPSGTIIWSPPYSFVWTDENNNVVSTTPAVLASPNIEYCVVVTAPDGCIWEDCFEHICCDSIDIKIEGCFSDSIESTIFGPDFLATVATYERHLRDSNLLDTTSCDPCDNPNDSFLLWVTDEDGSILNDPPYTFEWTDDQGNVLSNFPIVLAGINTWYFVKVTDPDGCMFIDSMYYECCEEIEINITSCYDFGEKGGRASSVVSATMYSAMSAFKSKSLSSAAMPESGCDPCETPNLPFFVWVTDAAGNELNDPPYTFTWKDDQGNVISTFPFAQVYVNQMYYVCVEDTLGCIHVDSLLVECCEAITPTNLGCYTFGSQTFLSWDPVPGADSYDLVITPYLNLPDHCCSKIPQNPQSYIFNVRSTDFDVSLAPYRCFSWRVRSKCRDNTTSAYSNWVCFNGNCPIIGRLGQEPSGDNIISVSATPIEMMKAYPNPTTGRLQLEGPGVQTGFSVDVYDQLSRKVSSKRFVDDLGESLDISQHVNGIYFLQLKDEAGRTIYTTKVVLMK